MKDVFLVGDSITMGYADRVEQLLAGEARVWRTRSRMVDNAVENARWSGYTLNNLARHLWFENIPTHVDVTHWNNGIWDTVIRHPEDGPFTPPEEYARNLERIARELKKISNHVIFATTIPPRKDEFIDTANGFDFPDRFHEHTIQYNDIARRVLTPMGILIEDMYALVLPDRENLIREDDNTHLTDSGVECCAQMAAAQIRACL